MQLCIHGSLLIKTHILAFCEIDILYSSKRKESLSYKMRCLPIFVAVSSVVAETVGVEERGRREDRRGEGKGYIEALGNTKPCRFPLSDGKGDC